MSPKPPPVPDDPDDFLQRAAAYRPTLELIYGWAALLTHVDIPGLLQDIARADALGPTVAPTLYQAAAEKMREDRQLLEAAARLRDIGIRIRDRGTPEPRH